MLSTYSIGVQFLQNSALIVCLAKTMSRIQVKEYAVVDLSQCQGVVHKLDALEEFLINFLDSKGYGDAQIYISFPAELSIMRRLTFPSSVKDELFSTIKYSMEKYIPLKAENLYFESSIISEDKANNSINVLLGAAKKADLKPFIDFASSISSGISGIYVHATTIANFICNDSELDIGSNPELFVFYTDGISLDIIFFKNGNYNYSRHIPLDNDTDNLIELIKSELKEKGDGQKTADPGKTSVVFCGNGFTEYIYQYFDKDPDVILKRHGFGKYDLPSEDYLPAVGLALNGLIGKPYFEINLLPEPRRKKIAKIANYFMYALIFMVVVFGIFWSVSHFMHQNMIKNRIDAKLSELEKQVHEIDLKKNRIKKLQNKIAAVNQLKMEQVGVNNILKELSDVIPSGSWLKGFSFTMGKGIRISGESDVASDLIPLLEASDLFENCVFLSAITKTRNGKERFSIGCDIVRKGNSN